MLQSRARATNSSRPGRTPPLTAALNARPRSSMLGSPAQVGTEAAEEATVFARVAGARPFLLHDQQQRVAIAVVIGSPDPLALPGGVTLAPALLAAAGPE